MLTFLIKRLLKTKHFQLRLASLVAGDRARARNAYLFNWDLIKKSTFSAPAGFPSFRGAGPELEMLTFLIKN